MPVLARVLLAIAAPARALVSQAQFLLLLRPLSPWQSQAALHPGLSAPRAAITCKPQIPIVVLAVLSYVTLSLIF
jgi:hypothetical protein